MYDQGGFIPGAGLISVTIHPDECIVRPVDGRMECARSGHPTKTSDCAAFARIRRAQRVRHGLALPIDKVHITEALHDELRAHAGVGEDDDHLTHLFGMRVVVDPTLPARPGFEIHGASE